MKKQIVNNGIYVILLCLAFMSTTFDDFFISQKAGFAIILSIILLALIQLAINNFAIRDKNSRIILSIYLKNNLNIKILLHLYTFVLIALGLTEAKYASSNMFTYINALSAIALVYLLGEKAWDVGIESLILTWVLSLLWQIIRYGGSFYSHLEFNDLAFASGYLFIYFAIVKKKWSKKEFIHFLFMLLVLAAAAKRIGIAALFAVLIFNFFVMFFYKNKRLLDKLCKVTSIILFLLMYLFVYLIINGSIFEFVTNNFDNMANFLMGRNWYWKVLADMCNFSPMFLGYGRNASATIFTTDFAYLHVGNVHSDILKVYMENGFILFGLWLWTYLFKFRKDICKKIGNDNSYVFYICTIYTFLVYLTDNTETYLITQFFYMLVPIICAKKRISIDR